MLICTGNLQQRIQLEMSLPFSLLRTLGTTLGPANFGKHYSTLNNNFNCIMLCKWRPDVIVNPGDPRLQQKILWFICFHICFWKIFSNGTTLLPRIQVSFLFVRRHLGFPTWVLWDHTQAIRNADKAGTRTPTWFRNTEACISFLCWATNYQIFCWSLGSPGFMLGRPFLLSRVVFGKLLNHSKP